MREPSANKRVIIWLSGIIVGLLVGGGLFYELQYRDAFYPGVLIGTERVGGRRYEDVVKAYQKVAQQVMQEGVRLSITTNAGVTEVVIPASSEGLTSDTVVEYFLIEDIEETLQEAYALGRTGSIVKRLQDQLRSIFWSSSYSFSVTLREAAIESLLEREVGTQLVKAANARFEASGGVTEVIGERIGEAINHQEVMTRLAAALRVLDIEAIELSTEAVMPNVFSRDLEVHKVFAQQLARSTEAVFTYKGRRAYASGNRLVSWLTTNSATKKLTVDPVPVAAFVVRNIDSLLDEAPVNSKFEIRNGVLTEIVPGKPGNAVDAQGLVAEIQERLEVLQETNSSEHTVLRIAVPVTVSEPQITAATIGAYRITDLIGTARTSLGSSGNSRRKNIALGIERINGLLIAPGQEFSAVNAIGYVTEEAGFEPEFVIKGNESVKELGGGLCQVSTTLFRTVLEAGLPITERQNHKYVVGYYGPGLDATIYGPHPDLRFVNDTGNYVLVQGRVAGNEAIFEIYGKKDGRQAEVSEVEITERIPPPEPKYIPTTELPAGVQECTEQARYGMVADATYTITYANGQTREQNFHSVYQPWQKVCLVGVGS